MPGKKPEGGGGGLVEEEGEGSPFFRGGGGGPLNFSFRKGSGMRERMERTGGAREEGKKKKKSPTGTVLEKGKNGIKLNWRDDGEGGKKGIQFPSLIRERRKNLESETSFVSFEKGGREGNLGKGPK